MKAKLLKKFRERFKFTDMNGYNQMVDTVTNVIYGPEWSYCHSRYSVKDHNIKIALELLGAGNRFEEIKRKKQVRWNNFLRNKTIKSAV